MSKIAYKDFNFRLETRAVIDQAAARPELEALHKELCVADCPWNGTTLFPEETR